MLTFTVQAVPVAQPRQRHTIMNTGPHKFIKNYIPGNHPVVDYKNFVRMEARRALARQSAVAKAYFRTEPLTVDLRFYLPRPKSKSGRKWPDILPHTGRPDIDNLFKSTVDALTGIIWNDDKQIYKTSLMKFYHPRDKSPCVVVEVY